ncbi:MAG: TolC family protein [Lysobacterales bacterium]
MGNLPIQGAGAFTLGTDAMTMRTVGLMQRIPSRAARDAERARPRPASLPLMRNASPPRGASARKRHRPGSRSGQPSRRHALLGALREQAQTAIEASRARLAGGTGGVAEALAARAELAALDNRIDAAVAEVSAARAGLSRWLGDDGARALADPPDFDTLPVAPARLLAQLDHQTPLLAWSARERESVAALDVARAGKRPEWRIGVSYGARSAGLPDMAMFEVGVSLPLFARHRQDPAISARLAERDAIQAEHEDARRERKAAVERALALWQGASRQVRRFRDELLPLAHDRSRAALAAYGGGADLQEWLDARRDETSVRIGLSEALGAWGRAWASLAYLLPQETTP